MVNAIACTIELWYTREVAKHERSVRVARGDSSVSVSVFLAEPSATLAS